MTSRTRDERICGNIEAFPSFTNGAKIITTRDISSPSSFYLFVSYFLRIQVQCQTLGLQRCSRTCLQRTYSTGGKQVIRGSGQGPGQCWIHELILKKHKLLLLGLLSPGLAAGAGHGLLGLFLEASVAPWHLDTLGLIPFFLT